MPTLPGLFAERLQRAISEADITQSNLAQILNVSQPSVSGWLSGEKMPTADKLDALARALKVNRAWLERAQGRMHAADPVADRAAYRQQSLWWFREAPRDGGRDYGNANIWSFDVKLEALVREVLQNARDAATSPDVAVNVVFRIIRLTGDDLRDYREALRWADLLAHLSASSTGNQKLATLIRDGLHHVESKNELLLLCIEDSNTTGLIGPEKDTGKFTALCRNNLDSNKDDAGTKGGAFGLGKAVLWRASRLSTVLFCSHLSRPENGQSEFRLLGRCELPWHKTNGEPFAGPGWFGQCNQGADDAVSFWGNQTLARDLYLDREGSGTTACVVGFHDAESDQDRKPIELADDLVKAAAEHFFPALFFGKLTVKVEVCDGRQHYEQGQPGYSRQVDAEELQPHYCHMLRAFRDQNTVESLNENGEVVCKPVTLTVSKRTQDPKHPEKEHAALLLLANAQDDSPPGHVNSLAMFRGPGMVIDTKSFRGLVLGAKPFHALLLCGRAASEGGDVGRDPSADEAAEEFLRTAEPPSHNKWIATAELKAIYARGCKKALEDFLIDVKKEIANLVKPAPRDLGDGPNSLRELFRIGKESVPTDRPRVSQVSKWEIDEQGRWVIEATVRLKSRKTPVRLEPAVFFQVETGAPQPVEWLDLEPVSNCTTEGLNLIVPAEKREVKFKGITNAETHPAPASQSCVVVDIRKITALIGGNS